MVVGKPRRSGTDRRQRALEALRESLDDLSGLVVGRVALRVGRLIIWLCSIDRPEPVLAIKLVGVVAFRDGGVSAERLAGARVGPVGVWGLALAVEEGRPEIRDLVQFDLWTEADQGHPRFQALARDVRVYHGAALRTPDRLWKT